MVDFSKLTSDEIVKLSVASVENKTYSGYSLEQVEAVVNKLMKETLDPDNKGAEEMYFNLTMGGDKRMYALVGKVMDEVLPKEVMSYINTFVKYEHYKDGDKPVYRRKRGVKRQQNMVTRAAKAGVYQSYRTDEEEIPVSTFALGAAASIDFERVLTGRENFGEYIRNVIEGLSMAIYREIQIALKAMQTSMPGTNVATVSSFDKDELLRLVNVVKAYSNNVVIYATHDMISTFAPEYLKDNTGMGSIGRSNQDIEDLRNKGIIGKFYGATIVEMPQSFIDETNTLTVLDPSRALILPGGNNKIVTLVTEGITRQNKWGNPDYSEEVGMYKKVGVIVDTPNSFCIYNDTSIVDTQYVG